MRKLAFILTIFLAFIYGCASPKFETVEDPTKKIEKGCMSVIPPQEGNWQVDNSFFHRGAERHCRTNIRLVSGGGNYIYQIFIRGISVKLKDDTINEVLSNQVKIRDWNEINGNEDIKIIKHKTEPCRNTMKYCLMEYIEYISDKQLNLFNATDMQLDHGEKYYYQIVVFSYIIGPFQYLLGHDYFYIDYFYIHGSTNNTLDTELVNNAYEILDNIKYTAAPKWTSGNQEN